MGMIKLRGKEEFFGSTLAYKSVVGKLETEEESIVIPIKEFGEMDVKG